MFTFWLPSVPGGGRALAGAGGGEVGGGRHRDGGGKGGQAGVGGHGGRVVSRWAHGDEGGGVAVGQLEGNGQGTPAGLGEIRAKRGGDAGVLMTVDGQGRGGAGQFGQVGVGGGDNEQGPAGVEDPV